MVLTSSATTELNVKMKLCDCCQWVVFLLHYEGSIPYASQSFCWTAPNSPGQKHHYLSLCLWWLIIFFLIQKRHYLSLGLCWLTVNFPVQKHHYLSLCLCWLTQSFPIHYYASLLITRLLLAHPKLSKTKACRINNCGLTHNFPRQKQSYFLLGLCRLAPNFTWQKHYYLSLGPCGLT